MLVSPVVHYRSSSVPVDSLEGCCPAHSPSFLHTEPEWNTQLWPRPQFSALSNLISQNVSAYWFVLTSPLSKCDSFLLSEKQDYTKKSILLKQELHSAPIVLTAYLLSSWLTCSMLHWRMNTGLEQQQTVQCKLFVTGNSKKNKHRLLCV